MEKSALVAGGSVAGRVERGDEASGPARRQRALSLDEAHCELAALDPEGVRISAKMEEGLEGIISAYRLFDGVYLQFNDFPCGTFRWDAVTPSALSLDWCERGRCEVECSNGRGYYCDAGDFAAHDHRAAPRVMCFPRERFRGFTLTILLEAEHEVFSQHPLLAPFDFDALARRAAGEEGCRVWSAQDDLARALSSFFEVDPLERHALARWRLRSLDLLCLIDRGGLGSSRAFTYERKSARRSIFEAERVLASRLSEDISVAQVAACVGMSPTAFKSRFARVAGASPMAYRRRCRMDFAAQLLESTDFPVADIANRVGYRNPSKFSAAFAQAFGCAPSAYRVRER